MKTPLRPEDYTSPISWEKECKRLPEIWTYAGLTSEVPNRNDWKKIDFFDTSVFLQNNGQCIEAFSNYCPHRFSAIRTESKGNGIIRCPYHSWTFGPGGKCAGIPGTHHLNKDEIRLKQWRLENCGRLLFICRSPDAPNLKTWLSDYFDELESISRSFGAKIDENRMRINANWKIIVENTLENYHVSTIHPSTFAKLGANTPELVTSGMHSSWFSTLNTKTTKSAAILDRALRTRPTRFDGYRHICIFPTMTIASAFGTSFALQEIRPLAPDLTEFTSHVFFTASEDHADDVPPIAEGFSRAVVDFNRQVFNEDKYICEHVHHGTSIADQEHGFLVSQEGRVAHFQNAVKKMTGEQHGP